MIPTDPRSAEFLAIVLENFELRQALATAQDQCVELAVIAGELGRSAVDLADLVAIEHAAQGARIGLTGEEVQDAVVAGDAVALRRVIANLVGNAVKFGRSSIAVAVKCVGAVCQIVVEDDGPGIPESERSAVFSPFYRIERSRG